MMQVKVYRKDPEHDSAGHYDVFHIPYSEADKATVMDVLDYISLYYDGSLAYYKHSACDHGICGRCGLRVNGKAVLACTSVADTPLLLLEPLRNKEIVKDLVVSPDISKGRY
jgi:succinate dehydrogenase/fumarate reductase-like Fe-S protein